MKLASPVTIHSGNMTTLVPQIAGKHLGKSAAECLAALRLMQEKGVKFSLNKGMYSPGKENDDHYDPMDIKTTLKVFLKHFSADDVITATEHFSTIYGSGAISSLIVAFPFHESEDMDDDEWLAAALPIWRKLEKLVEMHKVFSLGVADLNVDRLRLLHESVEKVLPSVNHYSIDGCCTVPAELVQFANEHDIQLLTHNDQRHFELDDSAQAVVGELIEGDLTVFDETWSARYTVWVRSRSVVASKGYIVCFKR